MEQYISEPELYKWYNRQTERSLSKRAYVIEAVIGFGMTVIDAAAKFRVSVKYVLECLDLYFIGSKLPLTLESSL